MGFQVLHLPLQTFQYTVIRLFNAAQPLQWKLVQNGKRNNRLSIKLGICFLLSNHPFNQELNYVLGKEHTLLLRKCLIILQSALDQRFKTYRLREQPLLVLINHQPLNVEELGPSLQLGELLS